MGGVYLRCFFLFIVHEIVAVGGVVPANTISCEYRPDIKDGPEDRSEEIECTFISSNTKIVINEKQQKEIKDIALKPTRVTKCLINTKNDEVYSCSERGTSSNNTDTLTTTLVISFVGALVFLWRGFWICRRVNTGFDQIESDALAPERNFFLGISTLGLIAIVSVSLGAYNPVFLSIRIDDRTKLLVSLFAFVPLIQAFTANWGKLILYRDLEASDRGLQKGTPSMDKESKSVNSADNKKDHESEQSSGAGEEQGVKSKLAKSDAGSKEGKTEEHSNNSKSKVWPYS